MYAYSSGFFSFRNPPLAWSTSGSVLFLFSNSFLGILSGGSLVMCMNHLVCLLLMYSGTSTVFVCLLTCLFVILYLLVTPIFLSRHAISVVTSFLLSFAVNVHV